MSCSIVMNTQIRSIEKEMTKYSSVSLKETRPFVLKMGLPPNNLQIRLTLQIKFHKEITISLNAIEISIPIGFSTLKRIADAPLSYRSNKKKDIEFFIDQLMLQCSDLKKRDIREKKSWQKKDLVKIKMFNFWLAVLQHLVFVQSSFQLYDSLHSLLTSLWFP